LATDNDFRDADSDTRFVSFLSAIDMKTVALVPRKAWNDETGRKIATLQQGAGRSTLVLDEKLAPDFGNFLLDQFPRLYRDYQERRKG
jgi:ParB family chromosome partitioning protein